MTYDIIGDVHGCLDELKQLFSELGYHFDKGIPVHPEGRTPVFVGDITDRGPDSLATISFVYKLVIEQKKGLYVPGNHCDKLYRFFRGNPVQEKFGLETTTYAYRSLSEQEQIKIRNEFMTLIEASPLYLELPEINTVVAHAGILEQDIGAMNKRIRSFVLYGATTGKTFKDGRPERLDWARSYRGSKRIVYGHTPVLEPRFKNGTVNIDTGCVYGNKLTAIRLPEESIVQVPSSLSFQPEKFASFEQKEGEE
ncbi:bis(5'-nucleosyl)-tetraphosphatase PrpE [Salimicrobium flavidum]|uniref:Bis(5'-nucleosyl)-tetraphosphatase (Symmetrical) n=1 Tax=Salimicrobium flavidum TaxID=570947 RepID=A0A1N7JF43_9BACI|nr:bis(5'-nucleosyl)-tetraphosphatase PrpE [Salimicrobium flavidum]SIS47871.1 bis(5'-nucleosyl)-tetraphosphatase (symmetrical) [Salimicrobium flavidum]